MCGKRLLAMIRRLSAVCFLVLTFSAASQAQTMAFSPAERKIALAQQAITRTPNHHQPYNDLALALARRARETSDPQYYRQAAAALKQSFRHAPDNFDGQKIQAWLLLGQHEFSQALALAKVLQQRVPDDVMVYGLLTDAYVELGRYQEAEEAAQWMLNLRPGYVPALTRAAYLRELFGDIEGAIDLMREAYQKTVASELEDRAWILTRLAQLSWSTGKLEEAELLLQQALELFPYYHEALVHLAKIRMAQQRFVEAVDLYRQVYQAAPHPEHLYALAKALEKANHAEEAARFYRRFEQKARHEMRLADNANRELIFYYIEQVRMPSKALEVAQREVAQRKDVYTLDAYAWALAANRQYVQAREYLEAALAVGIRDAMLFYHAGAIAVQLEDRVAAVQYLTQSLELNPYSEVAMKAREALAAFTD